MVTTAMPRPSASVSVVDESVSCVGETNDPDSDAIPAGEPLGLRVERADQPPAHRAKADQPDRSGVTAWPRGFAYVKA
jgi:hypothetical protein